MGNTPSVLFCTPGAVDEAGKAQLRDAGIVVVETASLDAVRLVQPEPDLPASVLLCCAGKAIMKSRTSIEAFGEAVAEAIIRRHGGAATAEAEAAPAKLEGRE